ncbi:hypothetical protein Tco_1172480 [Tanacetum coccineum]
MLCEWRLPEKGADVNLYHGNFPIIFCLKINHDDEFIKPPKIRYKGGKFVSKYKEPINVDHFVFKALMLNEPINLDDFLDDDADDVLMIKNVENVGHFSKNVDNVGQSRRNRNVDNVVITVHVANEGNAVSDHESESEYGLDSDDSEFIVDEENLIHDVAAKEDIDYEDFDSGTDSENKGVRKRILIVERFVILFTSDEPSVNDGPSNTNGPKDEASGSAKSKKWIKDSGSSKSKKGPKDSNGCPWVLQCSTLKNVETWKVKTFDDIHNRLHKKAKNPNTTVKIDVDRSGDTPGLERHFTRIYICLGALKEGFRTRQRELLGLDGCFLSGLFRGQILTAVGIDPNNGIYPLAYALVEVKPKIFGNGRDHTHILLNNMCEVLNKQLVYGWDKPIITCLKFIRGYLMKRIENVQLVIRKCNRPLTPNVERLFKVILKDASQIKIDWNASDLYQANNPWGSMASIWNMTTNEVETGAPEPYVHQCYWLTTWQDMYRFKVNPCDGPNMWPKSNLSSILTPPNYTSQLGIPKEKRRKSIYELANSMVKGGKLSREGKRVTCTKCDQVGHNQISCKGQRSTIHVSSHPTSQPASGVSQPASGVS